MPKLRYSLFFFLSVIMLPIGSFHLGASEVLDSVDSTDHWKARPEGFFPETKNMKEGSGAGRMVLSSKNAISIQTLIQDWEPFEAISFWMYSEAENEGVLGLSLTTPHGDSAWHYFYYKIPMDWSGWRQFVVRKNQFRKVRDAEWGNIQILKFSLEWDWTPESPENSVIIDDIRLLRSEEDAPQ